MPGFEGEGAGLPGLSGAAPAAEVDAGTRTFTVAVTAGESGVSLARTSWTDNRCHPDPTRVQTCAVSSVLKQDDEDVSAGRFGSVGGSTSR